MKRFSVLANLLILSLSWTVAGAQQQPVDISAEVNTNWCSAPPPYYNNCAAFPYGIKQYDGVTFDIPGSATANNLWNAAVAAGGGSGQVSVVIPVNIANVRTVYTLMNTWWGSTKKGLLSITFSGTNMATWTYYLIGGINIRDYNNYTYTDSIDCGLPNAPGQATTVKAWTDGKGHRLDMQVFELPSSFNGQTLNSITITDDGNENVQRAFLSAVTVSTSLP